MATETSFGEWLKQRRKQLDLTQQELADAAGCSIGTVRKIERDARRPSKQLAEIMADVLEIPKPQWEAFVTFARTETYTADLSAELEQLTNSLVLSPPEIPSIPANTPQPSAEVEQPQRSGQSSPLRHNLPNQPTLFIGREPELTVLNTLLAEPTNRLITIVGPGGMGKTRLAVAFGERIVSSGGSSRTAPTHGVYFVPLAPLGDPDHFPTAMAEAFDLPLESDGQQRRTPKQQVIDYLREKQLLLILDNFEHLLEAGSLVNELLDSAPELTIIVTSRERLHLRSEQLYLIQGLEFPDWETPKDAENYTAVKLFIQSAKRVQHDFELTAADLTYLSRICRLVSGMPLAVELAAGWVDLLPLEEIAAELQQSLDFLETEVRDVPERHRSMRAVFDASWQRMGADEQAIFPQLSIFRGGFTRRAGQAITGANLRTLGRLVSKSLLQYNRERDRYQMHELLRQYATEKLTENSKQETAVRDQHSAYYCHALHERLDDLKGGRQQEALHEIESDLENARAAWRWAAAQQQVEHLAQAMGSLGYFHEWMGRYQAGAELFGLAVTALNTEDTVIALLTRAKLLGWQSFFINFVEGGETAILLCQRGLELLKQQRLTSVNTQHEEAFILYQLGRVGHDHSQKKIALEQSLHLWRELDNTWGIASTLQLLGEPDSWFRTLEEIEEYLGECLTLRRILGDQRGIAHALILLSTLARYQGEFVKAEPFAREALKICLHLGTRATEARALFNFGMTTTHLAKLKEAESAFIEGIALNQDLGDRTGLVSCHTGLAQAYLGMGQTKQALEQCEMVISAGVQEAMSAILEIVGRIYIIDQAYDEAYSLYQNELVRCQQSEDKLLIGIYLARISNIEYGRERLQRAREYAYQSLETAVKTRSFITMQNAWAVLILLLSRQGHLEQAIELDTLFKRDHPFIEYSWDAKQLMRPFIGQIAHLPADVIEAARERGRQLDYWQTAEALLEELTEKGWGQLE